MAPPLIQLKDIKLTFGGTPLLAGVELSVSLGERVCLIGRNGSGKSTLLKIAAGQMRGLFVAVQAELLQDVAGLVVVIAGAEAGLDIGQRRLVIGEIRLLRQIADGGAGLHEAAAAIRFDQSGRDLQQRRLARAVAADQADAFAG